MDYTIKLHKNEIMNFKSNSSSPLIKHIFEETYVVPKEYVLEQLEKMLGVPHKHISFELKKYFSEREEDEFVELNNKLYDFWSKIKPQIKEWMYLYAERENSNFRNFIINLDMLSWCDHKYDTNEDKDKSYIVISTI